MYQHILEFRQSPAILDIAFVHDLETIARSYNEASSIRGLIVATLSSLSEAMWAYVPLEALVHESDLMVVGTLSGVSEFSSSK